MYIRTYVYVRTYVRMYYMKAENLWTLVVYTSIMVYVSTYLCHTKLKVACQFSSREYVDLCGNMAPL